MPQVSEGDQVLVTGKVPAVVSSVHHSRGAWGVFKVAFDPDEAIEAFLPPELQETCGKAHIPAINT